MENKLPEGWEWKKLGEIAVVEKNVILPEDVKGTYQKYIGLENIEKDTGRLTDFSETLGDLIKSNKYRFTTENILYGKLRPYLNKVFLPGFEGICSTDILTIKAIKGKAVREYVALLMRQPFFVSYANTRSSGANLPRINESKLLECKVPVPSLETQQKIVAILEKAEETKKLRAQADELTQKLLQSVFLEMFGDPVENPKNWNMKQLKDCIKIPLNSGWSPKCSDDISGTPVFSLANLQDQGLSDEITKYYSGDLPKKGLDLEIGDLLISRSNTVELVGRIGRYNGKPEKVLYPDLMIRIRLNENLVNSLFFEKCMQLNSTRKLIQKVSHGTSGSMVKISQSSLLKLPVILPPIELQQKFAEICNKMEKTTESQKQSSLEINNLFDVLMQKAFTGELVS